MTMLAGFRYRGHPWALAKLRKASHCRDCEVLLPAGVEAFRVMDNSTSRMERLCWACVIGLEKAKELSHLLEVSK